MGRVRCPRCGSLGVLVARRRGSRRYYYVVHQGDGSRRECYAGPAGEYIHASGLHRDLMMILYGPMEEERLYSYLEALVDRLVDLLRHEGGEKAREARRRALAIKRRLEEALEP